MTIEIICPNCHYSKQVEEDRVPQGARWATCPRCRERFDLTLNLDRVSSMRHDRIPSPWEKRAEVGLRKAIFQTTKEVAFSPRAFFRRTAIKGKLREPLAFGILFGSIGLMLELFWQFLMGEGSLSAIPMDLFGDYGASLIFLAAVILCPLAATLMICLTSLVIHFLLLLVGGARNGLEATFRAVSYSQATQFWALLPYVGGVIASLWLVVVQLIGIREIHNVSYTRVLIAFLIPVALALVVILAVGASFFLLD